MFRLAVSILSLLVDWSESPAAHKDVSKACLRPCGICTVGARNVICTNGVWRDFKRCCFENSCRERSLLAAPTKRVMIRWERWTSGAHCLQPLQWLGSHRDGPYGREWGEEKKYKSETKCILDAWFRLCCVGLSSLFVIYFFFLFLICTSTWEWANGNFLFMALFWVASPFDAASSVLDGGVWVFFLEVKGPWRFLYFCIWYYFVLYWIFFLEMSE